MAGTNAADGVGGRASKCAIIVPMLRWTGWRWQVVAWVILGAGAWVTHQFGVVPGLVFLAVCAIAAYVAERASR